MESKGVWQASVCQPLMSLVEAVGLVGWGRTLNDGEEVELMNVDISPMD